ncbi:MAG: efflux transporter periplasmic adaptor subunit, partial [Rhodocyclales bacterium CG_4_10_14_3_um_filter_68_10]
MPPPEVEVIRVERGAAELTRELPGRLQAVKSAQVRARVEAIVEKRLFREGSEVRAGQTLFKLDDRTYRAAALAAQAEVAVRRAQLERLEVLLPEKAVSQQDADLAGAQLEQAQAQLVRVQMDLDNTAVPAPIDGRIGRALVTEGALVGRGEATHLATIESIDPIQ